MQLTAIFESWHIGDGNYPPLRRGMDVNLSFQIEAQTIGEAVSPHEPLALEHSGNAEYRFVADVIRNYPRGDWGAIAVLTTGEFRFYIESREVRNLTIGTRVRGTGTLLLDYYVWVEFLRDYADPPELFYDLRVTRITKVRIPERFVARYEKGKSLPTRVGPADLQPDDYEELETMEGQKFDEEFYLVDFESVEGGAIARTFRSR
jgi:hypothetical protein